MSAGDTHDRRRSGEQFSTSAHTTHGASRSRASSLRLVRCPNERRSHLARLAGRHERRPPAAAREHDAEAHGRGVSPLLRVPPQLRPLEPHLACDDFPWIGHTGLSPSARRSCVRHFGRISTEFAGTLAVKGRRKLPPALRSKQSGTSSCAASRCRPTEGYHRHNASSACGRAAVGAPAFARASQGARCRRGIRGG